MSSDVHLDHLAALARLIRHHVLTATARAGSGHPTSALSATDLMTGLVFGGSFRYDPADPDHPNNDRLIFSKGHASPLLYALWAAAGEVSPEEMLTYREFGSRLEGHPTPRFRHAEVATGSLGQGLSIGLGMALNARALDELPYRTYVLLGDSEMAEGSQWEAIQLAAHLGLDNLIGVLDVNRLGQRGPTMYDHDLTAYARRLESFGWRTVTIDGHDLRAIVDTFAEVSRGDWKPTMVIARTVKGKGAPTVENEDGHHGKAITGDDLDQALAALGEVDLDLRGKITPPDDRRPRVLTPAAAGGVNWHDVERAATRDAYGQALNRIAPAFPQLVVLDGEVSNSTRTKFFAGEHPDRFFEMYVAEQNMVGTALGLERRGKLPFVSTFAAFLTRACDQVRMAQYSRANLKFCGSHAGVAIGQDGPSQMGLEDLAMFRSLLDGVVLYPADVVATDRLTEAMARHEGICYLRTTRNATPVIYGEDDEFVIGGSRVVHAGPADQLTIVAAGITLHEALAAHAELQTHGVLARVIDLYSVQPVDRATLRRAADETGRLLTVEDHGPVGGLGDAVREALADDPVPVRSLAVREIPTSGKPEELLAAMTIDRQAIVAAALSLVDAQADGRKARG